MPTYAFRCRTCGADHDHVFAMSEVPGAVDCAGCGADAVRRFTAPALGRGSGPVGRLIEATHRSAHEPTVVVGPPHRPAGGTRVTTSPLHARLPRP